MIQRTQLALEYLNKCLPLTDNAQNADETRLTSAFVPPPWRHKNLMAENTTVKLYLGVVE